MRDKNKSVTFFVVAGLSDINRSVLNRETGELQTAADGRSTTAYAVGQACLAP